MVTKLSHSKQVLTWLSLFFCLTLLFTLHEFQGNSIKGFRNTEFKKDGNEIRRNLHKLKLRAIFMQAKGRAVLA